MDSSFGVLLASAATVAFVHTVVGVDHYLPFVVLGRAERWSLGRTLLWTGICGAGHVLASVLLALLGYGLGWAMGSLALLQEVRGELATYVLIGFGLVYLLWGLRVAGRGHVHVHAHADGTVHQHPHAHAGEVAEHDGLPHLVAHRRSLWALFLVFVLGPCEPLIPILTAAAFKHSLGAAALLLLVFGVVTVGAMLLLVAVGHLGLGALRLGPFARYGHALAGLAVVMSGLVIRAFGL